MKNGFTLIELLVAIAIATVITSAIFFSLNTALESWGYSRDQLALQKVLSNLTEVISGNVVVYGLRDSLEILSAGTARIEFVPPWTDNAHSVATRDFIYTLNRRIKPGAADPIGEVKLIASDKYRLVPAKTVDAEDTAISRVRLGMSAPLGSELRFIYHPDPKAVDVIKTVWWDADDQQIYSEDINGVENISRNPFGVEIAKMEFRYYDNTNNLISHQEWRDDREVNMITGIELYIEAVLDQSRQELLTFINLRNAPMHSGYLILRKGTKILVPDSHNIHTLLISNLSGVSGDDELELEAVPQSGKRWRINIKFSRTGTANPRIESYTIEYPPQCPVYTEYPRTGIGAGLNLLTLGTNGLYDYDDDQDIEDFVILEGDIVLQVTKMDIEGAGLFVRP